MRTGSERPFKLASRGADIGTSVTVPATVSSLATISPASARVAIRDASCTPLPRNSAAA